MSAPGWQDAIDNFIEDSITYGRFSSENSIRAYREALRKHAEDAEGRGPCEATKDDVKRTLARYANPRTKFHRHSILTGFYDWAVTEDVRPDNPARKVQRARLRQRNAVYRMTRGEAAAMMDQCPLTTGAFLADERETRLIHLGLLTGGRVSELAQLRVRHFQRPGFVLFSEDIGKGGKARWVPVLPELEPIVADILTGDPERFVLRQVRDYGPALPVSRTSLNRTVHAVARRAGIVGNVTTHVLRHAFGDHIARYAGLRVAQALMGHESPQTTQQVYTSHVGLDELAGAVSRFTYRGSPTPVPQAINDAALALGGVR